jgi:hypothetical protein
MTNSFAYEWFHPDLRLPSPQLRGLPISMSKVESAMAWPRRGRILLARCDYL